jgi:hypothetical protein
MKEPNVYSENAVPVQEQDCSEEKCLTCFANAGCIYDHYLQAMTAVTNKLYTLQPLHSQFEKGVDNKSFNK